jgi:hypothetical protein
VEKTKQYTNGKITWLVAPKEELINKEAIKDDYVKEQLTSVFLFEDLKSPEDIEADKILLAEAARYAQGKQKQDIVDTLYEISREDKNLL